MFYSQTGPLSLGVLHFHGEFCSPGILPASPPVFDTNVLVTVAAERVDVYQVYVFEIHFLPI